MFVPGTVIAERYRLDHLLGQGGMGSVWAATHLVTRKGVALKFLLSKYATDPAAVRRFLREARAASAVRHPNVVEIHDVLQFDDGPPVMIMDLLQGESLGARLAREGKLSLADLARIMVPVLSALGSTHALGIVHRDLKPDNIFLEIDGNGQLVPKVLDFGIAKLNATEGAAAQTAELTSTGAIMGTPYYMAPEQIFGEKNVDQRVDVWAIGVILYEALSGQRPVDGENLGRMLRMLTTGDIPSIDARAPAVPADVRAIVKRMLSLEPSARPHDLSDAFRILRNYTDVGALSFPPLPAPTTDPQGTNSAFVSAPTEQLPRTLVMAASEPSGKIESSDVVDVEPRSARRRPWLVPLVGASVAVAGGALLLEPWNTDAPGVAGGGTTAANSLSALRSIEPEPEPPPPPAASARTAAPPPSISPTPSASARKLVAGRRSLPSATTTPTAAVTATAAVTTGKLPGGVADKAPF